MSSAEGLNSLQITSESISQNSSEFFVSYHRNERARNYTIRIRPDRSVTVTIPRRGSRAEAERFVQSRKTWIEKVLRKLQQRTIHPRVWTAGTAILFRGQWIPLEVHQQSDGFRVHFLAEQIPIQGSEPDLRPLVERHLQRLACLEFPSRVQELAALHQSPVRRVTVRNQRSRWGSCSRRGTISLNWRLIQTPDSVRDYIILHELMHFREMNHSNRFWAHVKQVCPDYEAAERWLKQNGPVLGL